MTKRATVGIYGTSKTGFAYLADIEGENKVFGDYEPIKPMPHQGATEALFAAADALAKRGVVLARVHLDYKDAFGNTKSMYADINPNNPPYFGDLQWQYE